jgi:hypothetical protein
MTPPPQGDDVLIANARDRDGLVLARHDNVVLYLMSSPDRLAASEAAWQDLQINTAPKDWRFDSDSALGPAQLSLSKR